MTDAWHLQAHIIERTDKGVYCSVFAARQGFGQFTVLLRLDSPTRPEIQPMLGTDVLAQIDTDNTLRDQVVRAAKNCIEEAFPGYFG